MTKGAAHELATDRPVTTTRTVEDRYTVPAFAPRGELRIRVPSALDAASRRSLAAMIGELLAPGGRRLIIDLGRGRGLDASLLRQLRTLRASMSRLHCELTVSASEDEPRWLLQLTGLSATRFAGVATAQSGPPAGADAAMMAP